MKSNVSVFTLMLKNTALRFYEDHIEKEGLVDTILFHSLVHIFEQEFCTKERESQLWLEWNYLDWEEIKSNHPGETKEKVMVKLLDRFGELRRWLHSINITDEMHKQRLLFAVANLGECFLARACPWTP